MPRCPPDRYGASGPDPGDGVFGPCSCWPIGFMGWAPMLQSLPGNRRTWLGSVPMAGRRWTPDASMVRSRVQHGPLARPGPPVRAAEGCLCVKLASVQGIDLAAAEELGLFTMALLAGAEGAAGYHQSFLKETWEKNGSDLRCAAPSAPMKRCWRSWRSWSAGRSHP